MKNIIIPILFFVILISSCENQVKQEVEKSIEKPSIIPVPVSYETDNSTFIIDDRVSILVQSDDVDVLRNAKSFQDYLASLQVKVNLQTEGNNTAGKSIIISLNKEQNEKLGREGYVLKVDANRIQLTANKDAGIFNGLQTLKQLIPIEKSGSNENTARTISVLSCEITDYPRFAWRGLMLDVSRHFFSVADVKSYIDKMAQYKFNVFHWHLTDDEGWRIEIKSLPKLTDVGAWRVERNGRFGVQRPYPKKGEKATYGGFYTQDEIRDIVKYASERNITIVPEIDIPGHSMAVLAAYPELSTKKEPKFVNPGSKFSEWYGNGKFKMLIENTLNPADEEVYKFVDKVFTEVAELFPGEYIHMGGDECYHGYWEADPTVRKFMRENNLKDTHELQSYFVKRVEKIISSKGKKMIGWDEILEGGLADGAAVMSWRGMKGGIEAAKMGHEVVMSPTTFAYLDYSQGDHSVENRIYADLHLEKSYQFEPVPEGVDAKYILGGQGNLWTEVIPNLQYAYYMTYPRAFAIAESLWSPKENKNWDSFVNRTLAHFDRFDLNGSNISKAVLDPIISVYKEDDKLMCKLENNVPNTEIFYTVDNTYPVEFGEKYSKPFEIPKGNLSLRTQTFLNGKAIGRQLLVSREVLEKRVK